MKNKLILGLLIIVGIIFSSYVGEPRRTYVIDVDTNEEAQDVILAKSKEGYRLVSLVAYSKGYTSSDFIIVMEK